MATDELIRVLIVDDSRIFRGAIQTALESIPNIQVVGSVFSGQKALEFIDKTPPDLVTLDIEMPGMSGLETLRAIQHRNRQHREMPPVDVLLVSALTQSGARVTVEGLQLGAIDFLTKPQGENAEDNLAMLQRLLTEKLQVLQLKRKRKASFQWTPTVSEQRIETGRGPSSVGEKFRAIAIGTSTGGPEALSSLLPSLVKNTQLPIFIVQHILDGLSFYLAESLTRKCGRLVCEVQDNLQVQAGGIYLAKSGKHMVLRSRAGTIEVGVSEGPPERGCRPSVDIFLRSAAAIYGPQLVSVILTGMGDDGTEGIRAVKRAGGLVLAQDEASCVVWGMPRSAVDSGQVDHVFPLDRMAEGIMTYLARGHTPGH